MLSQRTVGFLEGLANASNVVYTEGGLLFTFKFAYKQAGSCLSKPLQETLLAKSAAHSELTSHEMDELARFIQGSLGNYSEEVPSRDAREAAVALIEQLKEDLRFDLIGLAVADGGHDMTATLEMANKSTNNYYWLELWWSVD
jgi:hypothetical protein